MYISKALSSSLNRLFTKPASETKVSMRISVCLCLVAVLHVPVVTAQSVSETTASTAAMIQMLFSLDGINQGSTNTLGPREVSVFGLDDSALTAEVEQQILDSLLDQDSQALLDLLSEYSLVADFDKSTESSLALRATLATNALERLAKYVQSKDYENAKDILENEEVDINQAVDVGSSFDFTPIILAASSRDLKMVELLLSYGADPDVVVDERVLTALGHAVQSHNVGMTRALLNAGASTDFDHTMLGRQPLALWAAQADDLSLLRLLIDHGVDPTKTGKLGWTPLAEAIRFNNLEVAEFLVDLNDPRITIPKENKPSLYARFNGQFFPQSNALHLARHFVDAKSQEPLIEKILIRAQSLGGDTAVSLMQLQAFKSASQVAYAKLNLQDAAQQRQTALDTVDVLALDSQSDEALIKASMNMLINLHELNVISGEARSEENRVKAKHIGELNGQYAKWHQMLDIMDQASRDDVTALIEEWREEHGDPKQDGWNYDMLLDWADGTGDGVNRDRLYETIDIFRSVSVFQ